MDRFSDFNFCVIVTGRNCTDWIEKSLGSIAIQNLDSRRVKVCVTDDASTDGSDKVIEKICKARNWSYYLNDERKYALYNQYRAIHTICKNDMDVIVFVDADDWLNGPRVLTFLDSIYSSKDVLLTYGSFATNPIHPANPQPRVRPFPRSVIDNRSYRSFQKEKGIYWNHLRTFRYGPFKEIKESDLTYPGTQEFFHASPDTALMTPMLELVGDRFKVLANQLLVYNTLQAEPDWRSNRNDILECDEVIFSLPPKPLWSISGQIEKEQEMQNVYDQWIADGQPKDHNGSVDHDLKMYFLWKTLTENNVRTFIESGTSAGDAIQAMLPYVDEVNSIEAWHDAYEAAVNRFNGENRVTIYEGDSGELLPEIVKGIDEAVFWLDAHYSGDGTANLTKQTPILEELRALAAVPNDRFFIVIDDARGFGEWDDYPAIDEMMTFCADLFPNHEFSQEGDEIFLTPVTA